MLLPCLFMVYLIPASAPFPQAWRQEHSPEAGRDRRRRLCLPGSQPPLIDSLGLLTDPAQGGLTEVLTIHGAEKQHP